MRARQTVGARARHKKVLKQAKGMQHARTSSFRLAKQAVIKALMYSYRDRRNRKRDLRALWITRINAAARLQGVSYSKLIGLLAKQNIEINRKVLADLAVNHNDAFKAVVTLALQASK